MGYFPQIILKINYLINLIHYLQITIPIKILDEIKNLDNSMKEQFTKNFKIINDFQNLGINVCIKLIKINSLNCSSGKNTFADFAMISAAFYAHSKSKRFYFLNL